MGLIEVLLLSVGLAMDSFAVSICKGLAAKKITIKECLLCGIWFGFFQGFMPFIGYLVGSRFEALINIVAPWLAFLLLSFIGGNMIKEAFGQEEEDEDPGFDVKTMFMMAIATSIDAMAVGVSFSAIGYNTLSSLWVPLGWIGVFSLIFGIAGHHLGIRFGFITKGRIKPELLGGIILICIGLKILLF